jgi:hypothetical protein
MLSERRQQGHTAIEQCVLPIPIANPTLTPIAPGQRMA